MRALMPVTFGVLAIVAIISEHWPAATPVRPPGPAPVQAIYGRYEAIAVYDAKERELTITPAMPRETLVCLRGTCKLVEEWIER
jgi:hypothetical protein